MSSLPLYDPALVERSKGCNSCIEWHDVCQAECCKVLEFKTSQKLRTQKGRNTIIRLSEDFLTDDIRHYYQIHGLKVLGNSVVFRWGDHCRYENGLLRVYKTCKFLKGNLCSVHGTNKKPEICSFLTKETASDKRLYLTPKCLFRYQIIAEGSVKT